jgi:hypothetical protein
MKNQVTADILRESLASENGGIYFDDFLGDGDKNKQGETIVICF